MKNLLIFLNSTEREEEAAVQAAVAGLRPVTVIKLQVGRWMHGALTSALCGLVFMYRPK